MEEARKLTAADKKKIDSVIEEFLKQTGVDGTFETSYDAGEIAVTLETEDTGIVIGYHGEVLEALQLLLSLVIAKELGEFYRVHVEVGDYKKNRESYLQNLALNAKERALDENTEQVISSLRPWERRVVHLFLQEDEEVETESIGEGRDRVLVVKPREN